MSELLTVLGAVVPVFLLAGAGMLIRRLGWLTASADASLLRVTINVLMPCLIFDSILGNRALERAGNILVPPLVGFGSVVLGLGLCRLVMRWTGLKDPVERRSFVVATAVYNYGYVPLPLVLLLFDRETAGVLFVHNVGAEIAIWTLGLSLLCGRGLRSDWRQLANPPLLAIGVALVLNLSGLENQLPSALVTAGGVLMTAVEMLGQCSIPLGLVLIGAIMADHRHEFHPARGGRVMGVACLMRLGVLPLGFLAAAVWLPLSMELKRIIVLQAAMPSAVFPIIMTRHYGGDTTTVLRVVVATSLVGLVTIPLWIRLGMKLVAWEG